MLKTGYGGKQIALMKTVSMENGKHRFFTLHICNHRASRSLNEILLGLAITPETLILHRKPVSEG